MDEGAELFSCERDEMVLESPANKDDVDDEMSADGVNDNVDDCAAQQMAQSTCAAEEKDKDNTTDLIKPSVVQLVNGQMMT